MAAQAVHVSCSAACIVLGHGRTVSACGLSDLHPKPNVSPEECRHHQLLATVGWHRQVCARMRRAMYQQHQTEQVQQLLEGYRIGDLVRFNKP